LLDEATSALDTKSEEAVREALARLTRGRTMIAIAHRIATVRQFDRILVIGGGRVLQDDSSAELAARSGLYRELLRA
jgi:ATP-binding cassette subfamily B protein